MSRYVYIRSHHSMNKISFTYYMYIDLFDIIIFIGIAQGFFLALLFPVLHRTNSYANKILSILLLLACAMLLSRTLAIRINDKWFIQWVNFADGFIFLFGPLGHVYFKRLLFSDPDENRFNFIHYIPPILHLLFCLTLLRFTPEEYYFTYQSGGFFWVFLIIEGAAILLNFYYWYRIRGSIKNYKRGSQEQFSFKQSVLEFSTVVSLVVFLFLGIWSLSFIGQYFFNFSLGIVNYETIWIGIPLLIYIIGYYAIKQPEIFRIGKEKKETKKRLDEKEAHALKLKLEKLIEQDEVYLNNELTLKELAHCLRTTTNNLSWLLNSVYDTNFYDYINKYRIDAFLQKLHKKEHLHKTLFSLALEVGFNTKSTFNKTFKTLVKETPSNYIKKLDS